ncbi:MAG: hypothetical protein ISS50_04945 [Anaerolineae bacterium]|nr:hypothetical protein [Anaerolineae bacterium]
MTNSGDWFEAPSGEPGEMVEVKCAYCYGTGKDPFGVPGPESNCSVCGGKGYNRVVAPYVRCASCGGTGKMRGRRLTCTACKGRGMMTVRGPTVSCPRCQGTGRQPGTEYDLACTHCGGRGVVVQQRKPAPRRATPAARPAPVVRPAPPPPPPPPPPIRPASRPAAPPPPTASVADQIATHITSFPGVRPMDVQVFFGLSSSETEQTLQDLVQARRIRHKEDGLYYPA